MGGIKPEKNRKKKLGGVNYINFSPGGEGILPGEGGKVPPWACMPFSRKVYFQFFFCEFQAAGATSNSNSLSSPGGGGTKKVSQF